MTRKQKTLLCFALLIIFAMCGLFAVCARGDDKRARRTREHEPNWIIKRQTDYQVPSGSVPTSRMIIGRREIDVYSNGVMFEKGNVVGVRP